MDRTPRSPLVRVVEPTARLCVKSLAVNLNLKLRLEVEVEFEFECDNVEVHE